MLGQGDSHRSHRVEFAIVFTIRTRHFICHALKVVNSNNTLLGRGRRKRSEKTYQIAEQIHLSLSYALAPYYFRDRVRNLNRRRLNERQPGIVRENVSCLHGHFVTDHDLQWDFLEAQMLPLLIHLKMVLICSVAMVNNNLF